MRLLLDTATFIWLVEGDAKLSESARASITDPAKEVFLSAASVWEIVVKHGLGRLVLRVPPEEYVLRQRRLHRVELLPIGEAATLQAGKLPGLHPDPFDRIIVKQAISQGFAIVTSAPLIRVYPMPVAWSCVRQETGDPPLHPCRRLR